MSVVCRSFRQNAWKKDLCSDCFRPENDHQLVDAHTPSNGPNIITTTDWNGKVQALQSSKVNITEFKKTGSTNGYNKVNNGKNNMNENHVNTYKKSTPTTPLPSINHADENSFCNGDIINGKVAILNQRNLDKSDELSEAMKSPTTNDHSDKLNGNCQNNKQMVNKSNSKQPITKIVGILKVKSESGEQARKGSVQFKCDPIVIGYCDDDDSGNEEEEELDYCDYSRDEDDDYSEEESEFSRLTATNTRFNSIGANLRDAKIIQTFGQINNQSNGIAFRIGDFKSETKKHDYDETLIGCNRVSELIGEEKRVKLTNGSTVCSSTQNGINNRSSTTATTNSCGNNYINNRRNLVDDVLIKTSYDVNGSNSIATYDESNSRKEDGSGNINNNNRDNNSSSQINLITLNLNVVASSVTDSSSSTPVTGASSQANKNSTTTTTPSLTYSSVKLSAPINTSTNKIDNLPASINTHNSGDPVLVSTQVNGEININNDPSLANIVTNGEASTDYTSKNSSNSNSHNAPSALTSSPYCPTMGNATANKCSSSNKIDTCVSNQTALSSQSTYLAPSPLSIVTIAPIQSEAVSVNAEEKSVLQNKSCIENNDNTQSKPIVMINDDSHNIKIDSANSATEKLSSLSSPNEVTFEKLPVTNGEATRLEISVDHSIDSNKIMELNNIYSTSNYVEETEVIFGDDSRSRLSLVTKNDELENELCSDAEEDDRKNLEPLDSEIKSNDDSDIDDCSYTTDIADSTMSNVFISTDEEVNDNDDKTDNDDINEANGGVLKSSVSLTLVTKSSETTEERSVESIDDETNINNNNTINGKVNSIYDERIEIPKKPERTLKSSKPKIPSKPLSLSHSNKVNDEEYFYGIGIETHANSNESISDQNKQHSYDNELIHSLIDQSTLSKSEMNSPSCDTNHQSSRELRLAELAQELESVRHLGKRQAPLPPPPTHEIFVRSAKLNTLTRSGLPAPPPRPPPPSGLKHIVNGITSGYTGSNNFHSNGNNNNNSNSNNNNNNNNNNSGGTKFSLKKLLKLSKDDNDLEHNGESINGKIWKHKFDLDRRKSSPSHRIECVDRSTSGSYDFGGPSLYANGRERSYSLSGNSCLPQAHQLLFNQQQQPNKTNGFHPIVPARRSRSNDINSQNNDKNSSDGLMSHRFPISSANCSSSGKSVGVLTQSQLTISPVSSSACSPLSNTDSISSPSPPSSSTSPLPRSTAKLSSPSDLILTNLNLDSAYTVIAKYNADTVNRILHNFSMAHQSYKNISKKDLFYESFRLIGPDSKIYKDAYLKSETISAHFLVTPLSYSIRSEASHDLKYGQFIDSDENVKLFALKPEFDLIVTLDRLLDEDFSELTGILNLKSAAFLILQFISLLKYYQANGIEEINEDQLKLTMLCCNKKQSTNNMYLISPSFEYVTNAKREYSDSSTCFSLCKCVKTLVKNLKRKLIKSDDLLASVEDILNEETTSSLSEAKTICEIILFEVPFNFESQCTLELWLDIQRTKFINLLNYEGGTESVSHKTVYNYFFMLFLTRVNLKMLFQCINQMRGKLLPFS